MNDARHMEKRSMRIDGHRTSVALEPPFWEALEAMARQRGVSLPQLFGDLQRTWPAGASLASGLRCEALAFVQRRAA